MALLRDMPDGRDGFQLMDTARRQAGMGLELSGFGPVQSPFRTILTTPLFSLRSYNALSGAHPVLLIVPAPIKRGYIWDLAPEVSVIRHGLASGLCVYMIYWEAPTPEAFTAGLQEYAEAALLSARQAVERECGSQPVFLAGHSLGGTLAAIFGSLYPEAVRGLVLVESPLHFDRRLGLLDAMVARAPRAETLTVNFDVIPGSLLDLASHHAAPMIFDGQPALDLLASMASQELSVRHWRAVRWMLDELPMPRRLFVEVVDGLYREDRFHRGRLRIGLKLARAEDIQAPALCVVDPCSRIVPPESMLTPLCRGGKREVETLDYAGDPGVALQHLGPLIGASAHQRLWPRIMAWIHRQS